MHRFKLFFLLFSANFMCQSPMEIVMVYDIKTRGVFVSAMLFFNDLLQSR